MCKPTTTTLKNQSYKNHNHLSILLTSSSFHCIDPDTDNTQTTTTKIIPPSKKSVYLTISIAVIFLFLSEHFHRHILHQHLTPYHPIFENETHRHIIARHLGVDTIACFTIAFLGYINKHLLYNVMTIQRSSKLNMTSHNRIFDYQPESHRILLLFIAYQVKNLYDSWYWNDGIVFILHHIFAAVTAWFGMYPGVAGAYGIFFMGISEISTCVLCLLANFDDKFGVEGLDQIFPLTKIVLAVMFVVLFVICRCIIWPVLSYHFLLDARMVLKMMNGNGLHKKDDDNNDNTDNIDSVDISMEKKKSVVFPLKMMIGTNMFLTVLQILWLGEIIVTAKKEIEALM